MFVTENFLTSIGNSVKNLDFEPNQKPKIMKILQKEINTRITELIQDSMKFMKHSHRNNLTTSDIRYAILNYNNELLDEFVKEKNPQKFEQQKIISQWISIEGFSTISESYLPKQPLALSRELSDYYEFTIERLIRRDTIRSLEERIYSSLQFNSGIQILLPYYIEFIITNVYFNIDNLPVLMNLMRVIDCLLKNNNLHFLFDNHWILRDFSSRLLSSIFFRFGGKNDFLQQKIINSLNTFLVDQKLPFSSLYGVLTAISFLGKNILNLVLFANAEFLLNRIVDFLINDSDPFSKFEAQSCLSLLLSLIADSAYSLPLENIPQNILSPNFQSFFHLVSPFGVIYQDPLQNNYLL
ncbi:transcription initiation factor tfiid subunit 6 [Anaeramoeba ignava]|uniref:Transcription initiation factor tfiid subunit 6 n=1 Tax=Anaeramoeba ignava TaxID=1746090 RepID=A0A9Q0M056_ANAIG|nr:transcription initiation factor tfiid subunit 6 [Anaeramoeba ignava]